MVKLLAAPRQSLAADLRSTRTARTARDSEGHFAISVHRPHRTKESGAPTIRSPVQLLINQNSGVRAGENDDPIGELLGRRKAAIDNHRNIVLSSPAYEAAMTRFQRVTGGFLEAFAYLSLASTRSTIYDHTLMYAFVDDFLESAVAISDLVQIGTHHVAQRELRYVLENAVKALYVDQQLPQSALDERIAFMTAHVPRSQVNVVDSVMLGAFEDSVRKQFCAETKDAFSQLSAFVHPSERQLRRRLGLIEAGIGPGFHGSSEITQLTRIVFRIYDLVLVLLFHGVGLGVAGDAFVSMWDMRPKWPFHKGKYVRLLSRYFDYKAERQSDRGFH